MLQENKTKELVVDLHEYVDLFRDRPTKPDVQQFSRMPNCVHNQLEAEKTPKPHVGKAQSFSDLSRELQPEKHQRWASIYTFHYILTYTMMVDEEKHHRNHKYSTYHIHIV